MPASPFSTRRFLVTFSIAWFIFMAEHVILLYWYDIPLKTAILDSIISNIPLLGVCLLVMNTIRYYLPGREQYMNILIMCIVLTILWMVFTKWLLGISLGDFPGYEAFLHRSIIIRSSIGFLVLGIVTMMAINWYTWQEQQKIEERKMDAEKLAKEAELFKLRQQMQPHFLF